MKVLLIVGSWSSETVNAIKMNKYLVGRLLLICLLAIFVASARGASSYFYDSEEPYGNMLEGADSTEESDKSFSDDSLMDNIFRQGADKRAGSLIHVHRRSCIRRGGACDHRLNDCCYNSSCRCNLWGSNCRCQRMGLFQKWGWMTNDLVLSSYCFCTTPTTTTGRDFLEFLDHHGGWRLSVDGNDRRWKHLSPWGPGVLGSLLFMVIGLTTHSSTGCWFTWIADWIFFCELINFEDLRQQDTYGKPDTHAEKQKQPSLVTKCCILWWNLVHALFSERDKAELNDGEVYL